MVLSVMGTIIVCVCPYKILSAIQSVHLSPRIEGNTLSEIVELVGESAMFDQSAFTHGDLKPGKIGRKRLPVYTIPCLHNVLRRLVVKYLTI